MLTKLFGALMLKLTRLIVAIENAFRKKEPSEEKVHLEYKELIAGKKEFAKKIVKAMCIACDRCEDCICYHGQCSVADDDEGIPCYWEVDT